MIHMWRYVYCGPSRSIHCRIVTPLASITSARSRMTQRGVPEDVSWPKCGRCSASHCNNLWYMSVAITTGDTNHQKIGCRWQMVTWKWKEQRNSGPRACLPPVLWGPGASSWGVCLSGKRGWSVYRTHDCRESRFRWGGGPHWSWYIAWLPIIHVAILGMGIEAQSSSLSLFFL